MEFLRVNGPSTSVFLLPVLRPFFPRGVTLINFWGDGGHPYHFLGAKIPENGAEAAVFRFFSVFWKKWPKNAIKTDFEPPFRNFRKFFQKIFQLFFEKSSKKGPFWIAQKRVNFFWGDREIFWGGGVTFINFENGGRGGSPLSVSKRTHRYKNTALHLHLH